MYVTLAFKKIALNVFACLCEEHIYTGFYLKTNPLYAFYVRDFAAYQCGSSHWTTLGNQNCPIPFKAALQLWMVKGNVRKTTFISHLSLKPWIGSQVGLFVICNVNSECTFSSVGMMEKRPWSFTPIPPTSLTCGKRRCCRTPRISWRRNASIEWDHRPKGLWSGAKVLCLHLFFVFFLSPPHTMLEQKEKKDHLNPRTLNPRKIKTRKEEWERLKMGQEFVVPKNDAM